MDPLVAGDSRRCFVAVPVDHLLAVELLSLRDTLMGQAAGARPRAVPAGNFHLTLAFLGDTPGSQFAPLAAMLDALAAEHVAFTQPLLEAGVFPPKSGNCLAALGQPTDDLLALVHRLRERLRALGCSVEARTFVPHITLARLALSPVPPPSVVTTLPCHVTALVLYHSVREQNGVRYRRMHTAELRPG